MKELKTEEILLIHYKNDILNILQEFYDKIDDSTYKYSHEKRYEEISEDLVELANKIEEIQYKILRNK